MRWIEERGGVWDDKFEVVRAWDDGFRSRPVDEEDGGDVQSRLRWLHSKLRQVTADLPSKQLGTSEPLYDLIWKCSTPNVHMVATPNPFLPFK